jgi:Avidin family
MIGANESASGRVAMDIRGEWFNELNSRMLITDVTGSVFRGKYESKVGHAKGQYDVVGRISFPSDDNRTIAFVVAWQNGVVDSDAVTSWSGEIREVNGDQYITTTWLLTGETSPKADWQSTIVGKDLFTRVPRSEREVELATAIRRPSHHHAAG